MAAKTRNNSFSTDGAVTADALPELEFFGEFSDDALEVVQRLGRSDRGLERQAFAALEQHLARARRAKRDIRR